MKRTAGYLAVLCATILIALNTNVQAETLTVTVFLSPANENPPITGLNASGGMVVTFNLTRDGSGNIVAATVNFLGNVSFPGSVTITGLHIHKGAMNENGNVVLNTGLSTGNSLTFSAGVGLINLSAQNPDLAVVKDLVATPTGYYVNLHTSVNGGGAIRAQITKLTETLANTVGMNTANEVPPITDVTASGTGTVTFRPTRNATGEINGGTATFTVNYDMPASLTLTGLHVHEAVAGVNGNVMIDSGLKSASGIGSGTGKGTVSLTNRLSTQGPVDALKRLIANPAGFYVNLHTNTKTGGMIRGQLTSTAAPPVIQQSDTYFLPTGALNVDIKLLITGIDLTSTVLINGQQTLAVPDINTGAITVTVPASLLASAGTLFIQARNSAGLLSTPLAIVVSPQDKVNSVPLTTVDSARYGSVLAPEAIAAGFGTRLASQSASATTTPLPISLDGSTIYVNGVAAPLFFVSDVQVNFLIPAETVPGPVQVVLVAKDGTISRGTINLAASSSAIFTRKADGTGAPAAVASTDGQNFNILMSNADGTPVTIDAGNFVSIFGTGLRYASTAMTMTIGETAVTPTFIGAQNQFEGLDQINLQIPQSLAGKGDVDLVFTLNAITSNLVKLRIR